MAKRDVGMAGSSGYRSEFYTTDKAGNVVANKRTMRLQGMDPDKQIADSEKQERRVQGRAEAGLPMTDRDRARAKAVGGDVMSWGHFRPDMYDESDFKNAVARRDFDMREEALERRAKADETIAKQKAQFTAQQKYGDNSFKSYTAPLTKAMVADYKKKNK